MDFDDMEKILKDTMIGKENHRVYNFNNCAFPDSGVFGYTWCYDGPPELLGGQDCGTGGETGQVGEPPKQHQDRQGHKRPEKDP